MEREFIVKSCAKRYETNPAMEVEDEDCFGDLF